MVTIYCTRCDNPKEVEIDYLKRGKFITCEKCEESFNLFKVYEFLYNNITIVKKIVDVLSSAVSGNPRFTGNADDMKIIDHFRKVSDFDSLLNDVVFDTILFGNAFLEKTSEEDLLRRIDPATVEIVASFQQRPPFRGYYEEIDKLMQHTPVMREINQSKFLVVSANRLTFWTETGSSPMLLIQKEVEPNHISPNKTGDTRRYKTCRSVKRPRRSQCQQRDPQSRNSEGSRPTSQ